MRNEETAKALRQFDFVPSSSFDPSSFVLSLIPNP